METPRRAVLVPSSAISDTASRDVSGETYAHKLDPNYLGLDSNEELAESAKEIRNESPEELEQTIEGLENHD